MQTFKNSKSISVFLIISILIELLYTLPIISKAETVPNIPVFEAADGLAVFEAEDCYYDSASDLARITLQNSKEASGGKALYTIGANVNPDNIEGNPTFMAVSVKVDMSGVYSLWLRTRPTNSAKTIYVSTNGDKYVQKSVGSLGDTWQWAKVSVSLHVEAGETITYKFSPGNGYFAIDKMLVTSERFKAPSGIDGTLGEADTTLPGGVYNTPEFTPPPQHPRLYFTQEDIPRILTNALKNQNISAWKMHQKNLVQDTQIEITSEETGQKEYKKTYGALPSPQPGKSNDNPTWLGWFESWAFEYVTAGNEELGRKAIEYIKNYASTAVYIDANNDPYTRNAGYLIFIMSEVYDWCYPLLSAEDKKFFIENIINIIYDGIEVGWPPTRQGAVTGHGSEAQTLRDVLSFAVAVYDERPDIYNMVAGRIFDEFVPARKYHYASHMFHQGSGYGSYRGQWDYNSTWIFDRMGLENIYGDDQHYTGYWFLYLMRPDGVPLSDGDASNNGRIPGATYIEYRRSLFLLSNYYNDPYLKQAALDAGCAGYISYGHHNISPIEYMVFNNPDLGGKPLSELPLTKYFGSPMGHMMARTSWENGLDSNTVVAQMKVGEMWFANHHHLDAGHFQIYYKGLLAADSGRYDSYGDDHNCAYNKRTIAHNTILVYDPEEQMSYMRLSVNDGGQRVINNGGEHGKIETLIKSNKTGQVQGHEFGPDPVEPDYTYLKGDLTEAYSANKMQNFTRSFMFYNLKNDEHPAAMVVFDRVVSKNKDFKKTWLLHGVENPTVFGNQTIFRNDTIGYNGKLTVDTLLPSADNTVINVIGGKNNDFWINGVNYPSRSLDGEILGALAQDKIHDTDGYRIELSPKTASETDYFLNVLQVGESVPDTPALPVKKIETETHAGVQIADRVALFSKNAGRTNQPISFSFAGDGTFKINVADVYAGVWNIKKDGVMICKAAAADESGLLSFEAAAGSYTLTYDSGASDPNLPVVINNMASSAESGAVSVSADISGASENAYVMIAAYDKYGKMTHIEQAPYIGPKQYTFTFPGNGTNAEAMLFVWSGAYEALPLASTKKINL